MLNHLLSYPFHFFLSSLLNFFVKFSMVNFQFFRCHLRFFLFLLCFLLCPSYGLRGLGPKEGALSRTVTQPPVM